MERANFLRSDAARLVGYCTAGSVLFGWAHDAETANVWVEYFTVHHAKLVESQSPWVMAFLWGIIATFWVGMIGGAVISIFSFVGSLPKPPVELLQAWIRKGLITIFALAMFVLAGCYGIFHVILANEKIVDKEVKIRAMSVALTHQFSYTGAALTVIIIGAKAMRWRWRHATMNP